jgi:hypothetical protein
VGGILTDRGEPVALSIDLAQPCEAEFWCLLLDVSQTELEEAIRSAGNSVASVCAHLRAGSATSGAQVRDHRQ